MAYDVGTARGVIKIDYDGTGVKKAQQDVEGLDDTGKKSAASLGKIGTVAGRAGLVIAAGLGAGVAAAANFEQRLSAISAVSGATSGEMDKIRAKALQLGKDTAFSAGESAQAMEELIKAGLSVDDVLNGAADATVALAAAGEVALPEAAAISANAMNQFGLSAKDMVGVTDDIAGAANASAIDVSEFGMSLQQVGAVANLAGVSFHDTATAIALMGNAGIKGSDAGTSLKSMFSRLQPTTKKQADLFKELGIITEDGTNKFYDQAGNLKSLDKVSGILQNSLKGMTAQQKQATLQTLFGSDAIRAAAVLSKSGADGFNKMSDAMGKVSAADVAAKRLDNFKGSLEQMKGSLETLGITLGTILLPPLRQIVDALTAAMNWFLNLGSGAQTAVVGILAFVAGALLVVSAIVKIVQAAQTIRATLIVLRTAFATTWLAALGPIALVIAAIAAVVAVVVLLWKHSETFRSIVIAAWNAIKAAVQAVVNWFTGTLVPLMQQVWASLQGPINEFKAFMTQVWNDLKQIAQNFWNAFGPMIMAAISTWVAIVKAVWSVLLAVFRTYFSILMAIWRTGWNILVAVVGPIFNIIKTVISTALRIIANVILGILNVLKGNWSGAWQNFLNIARAVFSAVVSIVRNGMQAIRGVVVAVMNGVRAVASAAWNGIKNIISAALNAIRSIVSSVLNGIRAVITAAWNNARAATSNAWNAIRAAVSNGVAGVMNIIHSLPGKIIGALSGLAGTLAGVGRNIIQGLINGIQSMAGTVASAAANVVKGAINAAKSALKIGSPSKVFHELGKFTGQGFINGIVGTRAKVMESFGNMITLLRKANKDHLAKMALETRSRLAKIADHYEQTTKRLEEARARLAELQKGSEDLKAKVADTIAGTGSVVAFQGDSKLTFADMVYNMNKAVTQANQLQSALVRLKALGLNQTALDQIAQAAPDKALLAANAILEGGQAAANEVNRLQGQIQAAANNIGTFASNNMYAAGIATAQGLVKGLESQEQKIAASMTRIATNLVRALRRALKIKSPSQVMDDLGQLTGLGFIDGVLEMQRKVALAARGLSDAAVRAINNSGLAAAMEAASLPMSVAVSKPLLPVGMAPSPTGTGSNAPTGAPLFDVRVFIGDRELTDIVRVEVGDTLAPLRTMSRQGAI